jgi:serine/threonine protein kinase
MAMRGRRSETSEKILIAQRYILGPRIGSGSFGEIFLCTDAHREEKEYAVKLEPANTKNPQLNYEAKLYSRLQGGIGIPAVKYYGVEGDFNVMVMDLLGPSLEDLFNYCGRKFSVATVMQLGETLVSRVEYIHSKLFLHRDIKPDNFLIGTKTRASCIYAIDFGLAKNYWKQKIGSHIRFRENKSLCGTPRYASINNHKGYEQSRRDDLESLGYVLMYFLRGKLPWQGLRAKSKKEKYAAILQRKIATPLHELCKSFPRQMEEYLRYCRGLDFEKKPDYSFLRGLFREVLDSLGDTEYDWIKRKRQERAARATKNKQSNTSSKK